MSASLKARRARKRKASRLYRSAHPDRILEASRVYYTTHHEPELERARVYRDTHRERELERKRVYYAAHRKERREYYRANREKYRPQQATSTARRRARLKGVAHTLTVEQWQSIKAAYKGRCAYCGRKMKRLAQDHVVPISQGGATVLDNIVPACQSCNSAKHTKPPPKPVRVLMI